MFESWTNDDTFRLTARTCDELQTPRKLGMRCVIAESGGRRDAERWGYWTEEGRRAAEQRDFPAIQRVLDKMAAARYTHGVDMTYDASFGAGQQIVIYAPVGNRKMTPENCLAVREWAFNPFDAVPLMVWKLTIHYDRFRGMGDDDETAQLKSCYVYNTGELDGSPPGGVWASNALSYRQAGQSALYHLERLGLQEEGDVTQETIERVRAELVRLDAQAGGLAANGDHESAAAIRTAIANIIAAYPGFGLG